MEEQVEEVSRTRGRRGGRKRKGQEEEERDGEIEKGKLQY